MIDTTTAKSEHAEMTSEIVGAYVANNHVSPADIPALIRSVHDTLATLGKPAPVETPAAAPVPAVPVKKSITDDFIISLEDGRKFKSLKRYLTGLGMTPAEYRVKWNLPSDYPMVAPAYAARRSELAKTIGLGRKAEQPTNAPEPVPVPKAVSEPEFSTEADTERKVEDVAPAPKRGRAKKAA